MIVLETGYSLPSGDYPLTHARIAHANNWHTGGHGSASSTAAGYFAAGPTNTLGYERWKPTAVPATWQYDGNAGFEADYVCIGAHTLGTNGCTAQVQSSDDGVTWADRSPTFTPDDDTPIFCIFAPHTARYWRVSVSAGTEPEIGVVVVGNAMQLERPLYGGHAPIAFARQTILRSNYSETGIPLGRTKQRTYFATAYAWQNLSAAWVRANWLSFQKAIEAEPFFIAWRPETFGDVGLCQVDEVPIPTNMGVRDLMSVEMTVRAMGHD